LAVLGLIQISYSLPHALLEHNQNNPYPLAPSTSPWDTRDILEYGDDPTPPHIIAITVNSVEGVDMKLLRSELVSILQLMVNRLGEEGYENDAIVPVSPTITPHMLFLTRTSDIFNHVSSTWSVTASILRWGASCHPNDQIA